MLFNLKNTKLNLYTTTTMPSVDQLLDKFNHTSYSDMKQQELRNKPLVFPQHILDRWTESHYKIIQNMFDESTEPGFWGNDEIKISFLEMLGDDEPTLWKTADQIYKNILPK